jgi:restriction system protein
MVRGGRDGEREDAALTEGLAIAGWDELGDLTNCDTRDDLRQELRGTYPEESEATIAKLDWALWRFLREIKDDDLVLMPLKTHPQKIAIGRIRSGAKQAGENSSTFVRRHGTIDGHDRQ